MARMLLINPAAPPSKRKPKEARKMKKSRSRAQKAATSRLVALNKSTQAPKKRKENPIARARSPLKFSVPGSAGSASRSHRRANPIGLSKYGVMQMGKTAVTAAVGATALDYAWANLPIPAEWKIGALKNPVKAAGAVVLGMIAQKVTNARTAETMTVGALTVIAHDAIREVLGNVAPGVKLDGMGYYSAGQVMGEYVTAPQMLAAPSTMGEYVSGISPDLRAQAEGYSYY